MRGVTLRLLAQVARGFQFQPALPMRGVTGARRIQHTELRISTRTPHAGSDGDAEQGRYRGLISTRTPHAGSDEVSAKIEQYRQISTRTPHAGSDVRLHDLL